MLSEQAHVKKIELLKFNLQSPSTIALTETLKFGQIWFWDQIPIQNDTKYLTDCMRYNIAQIERVKFYLLSYFLASFVTGKVFLLEKDQNSSSNLPPKKDGKFIVNHRTWFNGLFIGRLWFMSSENLVKEEEIDWEAISDPYEIFNLATDDIKYRKLKFSYSKHKQKREWDLHFSNY